MYSYLLAYHPIHTHISHQSYFCVRGLVRQQMICSAGSSVEFQCFMDEVLRGLNLCYDYIDDLLVASRNPEEHNQHLSHCFRMSEVISSTRRNVSLAFLHGLQFLGHHVDSSGIHLLEEKVAIGYLRLTPANNPSAAQNIPRPGKFLSSLYPQGCTNPAPAELPSLSTWLQHSHGTKKRPLHSSK